MNKLITNAMLCAAALLAAALAPAQAQAASPSPALSRAEVIAALQLSRSNGELERLHSELPVIDGIAAAKAAPMQLAARPVNATPDEMLRQAPSAAGAPAQRAAAATPPPPAR